MWKTVLPVILVFSVNLNFTFADDSLEAREIEWLTSLREQIPQVSVSQQHISIAYLVAVLVETGRFQEARTIALNQPDAERRYSRLADISVALAKVSRRDEAFETIDEILARKRENYRSDSSESSYLFTIESLAEALVEYGRLDEFERRRAELQSADEKLYLLMGAIIGADYTRQTGR